MNCFYFYSLLIFRSVCHAKWDGKDGSPIEMSEISKVDDDNPTNRFNDGKCDPKVSNFFCWKNYINDH